MGFSLTSWLLSLLGVMSIIGTEFSGIVAGHNGTQKLPIIFVLLTVLSVSLAPALKFQVTGMIVLCLLCIVCVLHATTVQLTFIDIAEQKYLQALALALLYSPTLELLWVHSPLL